jgi:hypothetical protein
MRPPPECGNCGSRREPVWRDRRIRCPDCEWPTDARVPAGDFCSICRRRHGREITHSAE